MPIDPNRKAASSETLTLSAIENEIPAYRAISPGAIVSLMCGVIAILSYANWFFLVFAALAIVFGVLSQRKIQRFPDTLTGQRLAQTGIALGLIFSLTSLTITMVQSVIRERQARAFAQGFELVLTKGGIDDVLFYNQPPPVRKDSTPAKLAAEMKKSSDNRMAEMQTGVFREVKDRLQEPGADLHFQKIETHSDDGTALFAGALYEIHMPNRSTPGDKETFLLALMKAIKNDKGQYEWWVEDLRFPYTPSSFVPAEKPVDDGHGHAPGESH